MTAVDDEDRFVDELIALAQRNLRPGPASAVPMILTTPTPAATLTAAGGWAAVPAGMLILPQGLRAPERPGEPASNHTGPAGFARYGSPQRDFFDRTGTDPAGPVKTYLSDCPSFAPLDLGLWL